MSILIYVYFKMGLIAIAIVSVDPCIVLLLCETNSILFSA